MTRPTLLVLAAGLGRRFGGAKQMATFGPAGETLLEYALYDAWKAGFGRMVFVIREDFKSAFRANVLQRLPSRLPVDLAFQAADDLPKGFRPPAERSRPWGTGHAVWAARHIIDEPFAVIGADDFFGRDAFVQLAALLRKRHSSWPATFGMVAYALGRTLSEHGTVSRGICDVDEAGELKRIVERTKVGLTDDGPAYFDAVKRAYPLPADTPTSMNCFALRPGFFQFLEEQFAEWLDTHGQDPKAEFYLPEAVGTMIRRGQAKVKVVTAEAQWMGVTYAEDREVVQAALAQMTTDDEYPSPLWR